MRCWDGDYVVYNSLSGNTHILDIVAGELLRAISAGPTDSDRLSQHLAQFLDVPNDAAVAKHTGEILVVLDELGLIEAQAC